jgi:hypothetical protein
LIHLLLNSLFNNHTIIVRYPDVLTHVKSSTVQLANKIKSQDTITREFIVDTILKQALGISDATEDEIKELSKTSASTKRLDQYMAQIVSIRAQLGVKYLKTESMFFFFFFFFYL